MNNILFILNDSINQYIYWDNDRIKYFNIPEDQNLISIIGDYTSKIAKFSNLRIKSSKNFIYNDTNYTVINIEVTNDFQITDLNSFRPLNLLTSDDITYTDKFLLNNSFIFNPGNNLKIKELHQPEKEFTFKITILAAIIAFLTCIFLIDNSTFNYLGISVPIVTILFVIFSIIISKRSSKISISGIYFVIISILLSTTYAIYTNPLLRTINLILIPLSLFSGLILIKYPQFKLNLSHLINIILPNITFNIFIDSKLTLIPKALKTNIFKSSKCKSIIKGIAISIPLLILLLYLLSSADTMFSTIIYNITSSIFHPINLNGFILNTLIFITAFIYCYFIFTRFKCISFSIKNKTQKFIDKYIINTMLIIINTLYLFFNFVVIKYLYIRSNSNNLSAAEYSTSAREGFFQLLAVVVLNIIIIIFANIKVAKNKLTSILNTVTTIFTINMAVTSLYKMLLYITNFGFTRLRFLTSIFIIFIFIMLVLISISIWRKINLLKYSLIIGSILYLAINFCNMDKIITKYNLSISNRDIDINYLLDLSLDNIDVLKEKYKYEKETYSYIEHLKADNLNHDKWYEYNYYYEHKKILQ